MDNVMAVILAAGQGKRMRSRLPKVMHRICGKPLLKFVYDALDTAGIKKMVAVVGYGSEHIESYFREEKVKIEYARQQEQLGTGDAVRSASAFFGDFAGRVIIINGDLPMIKPASITGLLEHNADHADAATVVSARLQNPFGFGRIIRRPDSGLDRIAEQRDAADDELAINEINTGIYCFDIKYLVEALAELKNDNAQKEFYLTDTIGILSSRGINVGVYELSDSEESLGANDREELSRLGALTRRRICSELMTKGGVTIIDPENSYIDLSVEIQPDTTIYPGCVIEGNTHIGAGCIIGPYTRIVNSVIEDNVRIENSVLTEALVRKNTKIGPFAYLRPGTVLGENVKVGDFVELKNSIIGDGTKIPHLSYVGDADVGTGTNIGCGVITCNYDGRKKYRTIIGDNVFVGSNANLVAPVTVNSGAYVASGSTITEDVPERALSVARSRQVNKEGWVEKREKKVKE